MVGFVAIISRLHPPYKPGCLVDIEVMLFGKLRELDGVSKEIVSTDKSTSLAVLFSTLEKRHGAKFTEEVAATRGLRILINGQEYQLLGGMETQLKDKDSVVLLPPIEGG